ncbi:MAG: tetratricopeptide repeat protein [Planctomycetaceae bacterium]
MRAARCLTLAWPGLPRLLLRGSQMGLVLALALAVVNDAAVIVTWIWSDLVELPVAIGIWTAAAAIFVVATVSAVQAFPSPIPLGRDAASDTLFRSARDAYLARDWTAAETGLRSLLARSPADGEAQLLLGTLLRRVGRPAEARDALEKLSRADAGLPWRAVIDRELARLAAGQAGPDAADEPVSLPLHEAAAPAARRNAAA